MALFHVIIPAAGSGTRMGADAPKQYLKLHNKPLIQHVIDVFDQSDSIASTHVILSQNDVHWQQANINVGVKATVHHCGGGSRAETVLNGLQALSEMVADDDWVLVHDAARPGLSYELLNHLIDTLQTDDVGGLLALPLADTLKKADADGRVSATISRDQLWQAQTPQMFKYATLKQALLSSKEVTDEAQAIEALGLKPTLVTGALQNLKVTYQQDLTVLNALLSTQAQSTENEESS